MSDAVVNLAPVSPASSLAHFWVQADGVIHVAAFMLLAMSVLSWTQILLKSWQFGRFSAARGAAAAFWRAGSAEQGLKAVASHGALARMVLAGNDAAAAHEAQNSLGAQSDKDAALTRAIRQSMAASTRQLESGLTMLASIGAVAPFVGLFGTVWGIYHALLSIGAEGSASIATVSGPVGEALIMTAAGLFVAIPAVLAYNAFARMVRGATAELDGFAYDLHAYLLAAKSVRGNLQVVKQG